MRIPERVRDLPWRRIAAIAAGAAIAVALLLGLLVRIDALADEVDGEWMEEILEVRGPVGDAVALVFDFLGGGWFAILAVPLTVAGLFLIARRPQAAMLFLAASGLSAALVQGLKALFARARPADILLDLDNGAYPSGHVANAATVAVLLALLIPRWWVAVAAAGYVALMALSRTYLGAHAAIGRSEGSCAAALCSGKICRTGAPGRTETPGCLESQPGQRYRPGCCH